MTVDRKWLVMLNRRAIGWTTPKCSRAVDSLQVFLVSIPGYLGIDGEKFKLMDLESPKHCQQ